MTSLQVEYNKLLETKRNNEAQLAEMIRSHKATEEITSWKNQQDASVALGNLAVNQAKAQIEADKAAEIVRHNKEAESLTSWSNAYTQRHYEAQDRVAAYNAAINAGKVHSEIVTNAAKVSQGWRTMENDMIKFSQQQQLEQKRLDEAKRHNQTTEFEDQRNNITRSMVDLSKSLPLLDKIAFTADTADRLGRAAKTMYRTGRPLSSAYMRERLGDAPGKQVAKPKRRK